MHFLKRGEDSLITNFDKSNFDYTSDYTNTSFYTNIIKYKFRQKKII